MPNNPVQVILNSKDYITTPLPRPKGGRRKDFFAGRDTEFIKHKVKLQEQVQSISERVAKAGMGDATVIRATLREEALAKSHRPISALLKPDEYPCVGANGLGELHYALTLSSIPNLIMQIENAENSVNKDDSGKPKPSKLRSEVGSVVSFEELSEADKRHFSVNHALQWLSSKNCIGGYLLELHKLPSFSKKENRKEYQSLLISLSDILTSQSNIRASLLRGMKNQHLIDIKITEDKEGMKLIRSSEYETLPTIQQDFSADKHRFFLNTIASHPLIKRISLPPKISPPETSEQPSTTSLFSQTPELSNKKPNTDYPVVGLIDDGVSKVLGEWILDKHDFLEEVDYSTSHGTFIAGILTNGQKLNNNQTCPEHDGCNIYDIPLYPENNFSDYYPSNFDGFIDEIESAVQEAKDNHGVRIFNLSINVTSEVQRDYYSPFSSRLDEICDRHQVIIVNSVGNLRSQSSRSPWPRKVKDIQKYFAERTETDTIYQPSESVRMLSIGALNPADCKPHVHGTPTTYTRRGPGLAVGQKPDLAHYGGSEPNSQTGVTGLNSLTPNGTITASAGTSFATPLVAKSLATLDLMTNHKQSTQTLRALLIHHAQWPENLKSPRLRELVRQFIGFGQPTSAQNMLKTDDFSISLVFEGKISRSGTRRQILKFPFSWPQSLVDPSTGACRGSARMTLVYHAPLDRQFGSEFVRVNLDAKLRQKTLELLKDGSHRYETRSTQVFLPKTANQPVYEKDLIKQGLKWWPIKRYDYNTDIEGTGESSEWQLEVESTMRAEAVFPSDGISFSLIVTLEDPQKNEPIFQEMRRALQASKVSLADIDVRTQIQT